MRRRGQATADALWPFAIVAILVLVVIGNFVIENLALFGILGGIALVGFVAWLITSSSSKKKQQEEEMRRLVEERKQRKEKLLAKYEDEEIVKLVMDSHIWVGQTAEMLTDALGKPEAIDIEVPKTKKKEIWKYAHKGGNRYGIRITLDNDEVVKFDVKGEHLKEH